MTDPFRGEPPACTSTGGRGFGGVKLPEIPMQEFELLENIAAGRSAGPSYWDAARIREHLPALLEAYRQRRGIEPRQGREEMLKEGR